MKQTLMLLKGEINSNTKIVGVFNTPVLIADRTYNISELPHWKEGSWDIYLIEFIGTGAYLHLSRLLTYLSMRTEEGELSL